MITDPENKPHEGVCPNCSAELVGPYCAVCGQHQVDLERPLRALLGEAMDSFLDFDERILRTLTPLITRPGLLTVEFLAGRRKRYVHPFKLYFALSLALFLALSMWGYTVVQVAGDDRIVVTTEGMTTGVELKRSEGSVQAEAPSFLDWAFDPLIELMEKNPDRLNKIFIDRLAQSIVVLVPVFALLLRPLYWKSSYLSQFVFSLYLHSFAFLAILAGMAFNVSFGTTDGSGPGDGLVLLTITVHTFLALRRTQGQRRLLTAAKMVVLVLGYLVALILTMILTLLLTAFTL